jgi:hypothetical protein
MRGARRRRTFRRLCSRVPVFRPPAPDRPSSRAFGCCCRCVRAVPLLVVDPTITRHFISFPAIRRFQPDLLPLGWGRSQFHLTDKGAGHRRSAKLGRHGGVQQAGFRWRGGASGVLWDGSGDAIRQANRLLRRPGATRSCFLGGRPVSAFTRRGQIAAAALSPQQGGDGVDARACGADAIRVPVQQRAAESLRPDLPAI